jgi:selenide,water dikinase
LTKQPRRQLLLLGGGHAHLAVLDRLAHQTLPGWAVTLVTPHPRLLYSGMVPGWVAGHYAIGDCAISLADLAARAGVRFHRSTVIGLDLGSNEVLCGDGNRLRFDLLSIDTGPAPAIGGIPGAAVHALPLRPIEGFVAAWPGVVTSWHATTAPFDVAIVGGGAAAVELAFAIRHRAAIEHAGHVHVHLLGREDEPLIEASRGARRRASRLLGRSGIGWRGASTAMRIDRGRVFCSDGAEVAFDVCVVATGAAAPPWPRASGLAVDDQGYIRVDRMLRSISHPHVLAAGDVAAYADARPKSGVFAVRAGPVLAANLIAACTAAPLRSWRPQHRALYLVSLGERRAIASWGSWSAAGRWVWRWKDRIDRGFVRRYRR